METQKDITGPPTRPDPLDQQIGKRLKQRREDFDMMQHDMATVLGIPKEQLDHYERGITPITASRLYRVAQQWGLPITWFFEQLTD